MALAPSQRNGRGRPVGRLRRAAAESRRVEPAAGGPGPIAVRCRVGFDADSDAASPNGQAGAAGVTDFLQHNLRSIATIIGTHGNAI
jgi:hypothetical protein